MSRRGKLVLAGIASVLAVGSIICWTMWGDLIRAASELPRHVSEAKQAGLAFEPEDLKPTGSGPNAHEVYLDVLAALDKDYRSRSEEADQVAAAWNSNPKLLDQMVRAANCELFDSKMDLTKGLGVSFSHLSEIKDLVKGLSFVMLDAARRGDAAKAERCLTAMTAVARHLDSEPFLISSLVSLALKGICVSAVWRVASENSWRPEWSRLAARLDDLVPKKGFDQLVRGEVFLACQSFKDDDPWGADWSKVVGEDYEPEPGEVPPKGPGSRDAYLSRYLEHETWLFKALQDVKDIGRVIAILDEFDKRLVADKRISAKGVKLLSGSYHMTGRAWRQTMEATFIVREGIKLLGARAKGAAFPKQLRLDDSRLRYKRLATGFKLYTVGLDGKDSGGPTRAGLGRASMESDDYGILFGP